MLRRIRLLSVYILVLTSLAIFHPVCLADTGSANTQTGPDYKFITDFDGKLSVTAYIPLFDRSIACLDSGWIYCDSAAFGKKPLTEGQVLTNLANGNHLAQLVVYGKPAQYGKALVKIPIQIKNLDKVGAYTGILPGSAKLTVQIRDNMCLAALAILSGLFLTFCFYLISSRSLKSSFMKKEFKRLKETYTEELTALNCKIKAEMDKLGNDSGYNFKTDRILPNEAAITDFFDAKVANHLNKCSEFFNCFLNSNKPTYQMAKDLLDSARKDLNLLYANPDTIPNGIVRLIKSVKRLEAALAEIDKKSESIPGSSFSAKVPERYAIIGGIYAFLNGSRKFGVGDISTIIDELKTHQKSISKLEEIIAYLKQLNDCKDRVLAPDGKLCKRDTRIFELARALKAKVEYEIRKSGSIDRFETIGLQEDIDLIFQKLSILAIHQQESGISTKQDGQEPEPGEEYIPNVMKGVLGGKIDIDKVMQVINKSGDQSEKEQEENLLDFIRDDFHEAYDKGVSFVRTNLGGAMETLIVLASLVIALLLGLNLFYFTNPVFGKIQDYISIILLGAGAQPSLTVVKTFAEQYLWKRQAA